MRISEWTLFNDTLAISNGEFIWADALNMSNDPDWVLPTVDQLVLLRMAKLTEIKGPFWSSSPYTPGDLTGENGIFVVNFSNGLVGYDYRLNEYHILLINKSKLTDIFKIAIENTLIGVVP